MDLELLDAINRDWQADRLRAARDARLLRDNEDRRPRGRGRARIAAFAVIAGLILALAIGLAVAAASGSANGLVGLLA
jgi:hypothetical protein